MAVAAVSRMFIVHLCYNTPGWWHSNLPHRTCNQPGKLEISLLSVKFLYYLGHFDKNITVAKNYPGFVADHSIGGYVLRKSSSSFVEKMERHHNSTKFNDMQSVVMTINVTMIPLKLYF